MFLSYIRFTDTKNIDIINTVLYYFIWFLFSQERLDWFTIAVSFRYLKDGKANFDGFSQIYVVY